MACACSPTRSFAPEWRISVATARSRRCRGTSTPSSSHTCITITSTCRRCAFSPAGRGSWRPWAPVELLRRAGFEVEELEEGQRTTIRGLRVEAVRADHSPVRLPVRGPRAEPLGFVIGERPSVYFAGDTDLFPEMAELAPVDVALLPVAGWGPRLGPGHMDTERAARAAALLKPRVAIPIHWGTLHPRHVRRGEWFSEPAAWFAAQVAAVAPEVEVLVLRPGESASVEA